ncbi:beta-lactamase family protein [Sporothrix brasiliensis 5110]|uniref:Beta-lactamase family protein n=1 Tax=Sporothrix brasiliensis 5110 TaxID=1398154 RepID=A0A0C2IVE9_9PEZI|nr:beta-lactamase family protein [Sporothrix brasiliensis 5110]KIH90750.1 beta-lactamase family protein [Sporothrix brasiliensis 5110]
MAASFEQVIAEAVAGRTIPGVVLLAENKSGSLHYEKVLGLSSVEPGKEQALAMDSVFMFMSMTKLITCIVALQAVERGLWDLDADVAPLLPELAALPVLAGFSSDADNATPILEAREAPITLRLLLTHSSGVGYDFLTADLIRYRAWLVKQPPEAGLEPPPKMSPAPPSVEERFRLPLAFQPGQGWTYGAGIDWTARLLERLYAKVAGQTAGAGAPDSAALSASGESKLPFVPFEDIVIRDILTPLGLPAGALTFHPERYPDVMARVWPSLPGREGGPDSPVVHGPSFYSKAPAALGGQGMYGDMPSFFVLLRSLLHDDGTLLPSKSATTELLFTPQLPSDASRQQLLRSTENSAWITGDVPDTKEYDWSLGGLLVTGTSHPVRRKGAVFWSGAINLTWILDREAGLAAVFASNFQPPGDPQAKALMRAWEAFIYPQAANL